MKKHILILTLMMLVALVAIPATAVDYTGTLAPVVPATQIIDVPRAATNNFAYDGTNYIIQWRTNFDTIGIPSSFISYSLTDCFAIGTTTFTLQDATGVFGTGSIQFLNGTAMYGVSKQYMYMTFSTWTPGTRTGFIVGNLTILSAGISSQDGTGASIFGVHGTEGTGVAMPLGGNFGGVATITGAGGAIYTPQPYTIEYDYTVTGFGGTGASLISEVIFTRPSNNLATNAQTRDATTGALNYQSVHTDATSSEDFLTVGDNYHLTMYVPLTGQYYNSSTFYPTSTTTPPGYITTWGQCVDGFTSGSVHGSTVNLTDVENGTYVRSVADTDGTLSITTLATHTINLNCTMAGYIPVDRTGLPAADIVYEGIMWPTSTANSTVPWMVNLYVIVNDKTTTLPIEGASVQATVPSGATQAATTNAAGTVTFQIANVSLIRLTASIPGYWTGTTTITTTDFGPDTKRIELQRATVGPTITATPLPGEVTARPTVDMRTAAQKDADMMNQVRDWGPTLISFACIMTLLYMVGYKP